jgi:DNA-binding NarL/FixJ family response regulator
MPLDNRTLVVSSLLVTAVLSLLDILIWRTRNTFSGFGRWAIDARDVDSALDLLRQGPVDVLLTDIQMPGRSGIELARLVVRDFPGIRVIAMSGFEESELNQLPRELGIDAALMKPMQPEVLIGAVREAVERARVAKPA